MTAKHVEVLRMMRNEGYWSEKANSALDAAIAALNAGAVGDAQLADEIGVLDEIIASAKRGEKIFPAYVDRLNNIRSRLAQPQRQGQAVASFTITEASVGEAWNDGPVRMTEAGRQLPPGTYQLYTEPPASQGITEAGRKAIGDAKR